MRCRIFKIFSIIPLTLSLIFSPVMVELSLAKESGGINTNRAAKALLEGVRDFFKDLDEYQRLNTDQEKVNYILSKGSDRIIQKSGELAWDRLKSEMANLAAAKAREGLFKEQLPTMMHKVLVEKVSTSAAWQAANADILSKIDTRINAVKTAVVSAKVIVKGLTEWRKTGDARKGFEAFGKSAADEIAAYFIPGWKLYRVAQAIVEALGLYVTGYAFDTALEAKVKAVLPFPPESNPKGFIEWIQTVDINDHVTKEWNEQLAYSGWYLKFSLKSILGQQESGDNMKQAIIAALEKMKSDILAEKAKMDQIEREFESKIRDLETKSDQANKQAMSVLDQIFAKADPYLKMIEDYKAAAFPNQKKDLEADITEAEQAMSQVPTSVAYNPVDASSVLAALETALSEVTDDYRSGYDYKKGQELWGYYVVAQKRASEESARQFNQLAAQLNAAKDPNEQARLGRAYHIEWPRKRDADFAALAAKQSLVVAEASERCRKMVETLKSEFQKMNDTWAAAYAEYQTAEASLQEKIRSTFKYPDIFGDPEQQIPYFAPNTSDLSYPDYVLNVVEPLRMFKRDVEKDAMLVSGIRTQHRGNVEKLQATYYSLKGNFERVVQKDYRRVQVGKVWDPESWTAYMHVAWEAGGLGPLQALRDEGESVVTVYIGDRPWERLKEEPDTAKGYQSGLRWLSDLLGNVELLERPAALAASFWKILGMIDLRKYETDALRSFDMERYAHMQDGKWGAAVKPEESDGAKFLEQMKKDWEANREEVLQVQKIREAYTAFGKNYFKYGDPEQDKLLDQYLKIPLLIQEYEKMLAAESKKFVTAREAMAGNLELMKQRFAKLKQEIRGITLWQPVVDKMEKFRKETALERKNTEIMTPDATEVLEGMKAIEDEVTAMIEDAKKKIAERAAAGTGASSGASTGGGDSQDSAGQGGAKTPSGTPGSGPMPVLDGFYKLYDARLNTHSLQDVMGGEVVVTTADLRSGTIEITARLSTIERIQTLLVSEDGARTWTQIGLSQDLTYRFSPMAEKPYHLVLKIKTTDSQETMIGFFPNVSAIVYRNISYIDLVQEAVAKLANAYESQNVAAFSDLISRDYLGNRVFLEEGVRFDFDMFTDIRLKIFIDRIEQRGDLYLADTHWEKSQSPRKTGLQQMTTGKTVMTFALEEGRLRIKNLRGNLIYATLSPEIAEASGLSQTVVEEIRVAEAERDPIQPGAGETENPGGLGGAASNIETGNFSLTQTNGHAAAAWIQEFNFASKQVMTVDDFGPTYDFRRREGWMEVKTGNGIVDMGAVDINSVTEAPLSGYATQVGSNENNTYAIQLSNGTYALVQSTAWGGVVPSTTSFRYRHQKNGTRSFN